ncbi:hypothetical protein I8540_002210 [Clostridium perfringens]|nr:hypothetical protein [Clostridium perfringens]
MVNKFIFKKLYLILSCLLILGICLVCYFLYLIKYNDSFARNKYYYELLNKDPDSFLSKVDEIGIRIDCGFRKPEEIEKVLTNIGCRDFSHNYYIVNKNGEYYKDNNADNYILTYSNRENLLDDYRKIKSRFPSAYISLELIGGHVSLTEKEYLKEYGEKDVDKNLFRPKKKLVFKRNVKNKDTR